jgi:hypothetical protein
MGNTLDVRTYRPRTIEVRHESSPGWYRDEVEPGGRSPR